MENTTHEGREFRSEVEDLASEFMVKKEIEIAEIDIDEYWEHAVNTYYHEISGKRFFIEYGLKTYKWKPDYSMINYMCDDWMESPWKNWEDRVWFVKFNFPYPEKLHNKTFSYEGKTIIFTRNVAIDHGNGYRDHLENCNTLEKIRLFTASSIDMNGEETLYEL